MPITTGPAQSTLEAMLKADIGAEAKAMNASARPQPEAVQAPNGRVMQGGHLLYQGASSSQASARQVPHPSASANPAAQAVANSILQSVQQMMGREVAMNPFTATGSSTGSFTQSVGASSGQGSVTEKQEAEPSVKSKPSLPNLTLPSSPSPHAPRVNSPLLHSVQVMSSPGSSMAFDWSPDGISERFGAQKPAFSGFSYDDVMDTALRQELDQTLARNSQPAKSEVEAVAERAKQSRENIQKRMHGGQRDDLHRTVLKQQAWKVENGLRRDRHEAGQAISNYVSKLEQGSGPDPLSADPNFRELTALNSEDVKTIEDVILQEDTEPAAKRRRTDDVRLSEADYAGIFGLDTTKW